MDRTRRVALKGAGMSSVLFAGLATGLLRPTEALATTWNKNAFEAKTVADALKSLEIQAPADSSDIAIKAPDIAENGAVVPLTACSFIREIFGAMPHSAERSPPRRMICSISSMSESSSIIFS